MELVMTGCHEQFVKLMNYMFECVMSMNCHQYIPYLYFIFVVFTLQTCLNMWTYSLVQYWRLDLFEQKQLYHVCCWLWSSFSGATVSTYRFTDCCLYCYRCSHPVHLYRWQGFVRKTSDYMIIVFELQCCEKWQASACRFKC